MDFALTFLTSLLLLATPVSPAVDLAAKADEAASRKESFVAADNGARFLPAELRFGAKLASPEIAGEVEPAVAAIADFSEQLKAAGAQLIVVPVPPRVLQEAAALGVPAEEQKKMQDGWQSILSALAAKQVDVINLAPDFSLANENPYCVRDTHWSGHGIDLAASKIVQRLQAAGISAQWPPAGVPAAAEVTITGDLGGDAEKVKLRAIPQGPAAETASGPLLLLGDSHLFVFHRGGEFHTADAGLPDQLRAATGATPEVIAVLGSGATSSRVALARRARADEAFLGTKKIVVWVFAGREFTEADSWKKVPVLAAKKNS